MTKSKEPRPRKRVSAPKFSKETLRKLTATELSAVGGADEEAKTCSRMSCCDDCLTW